MPRPRKLRRVNRLAYQWQYLDCRSCHEPNLHRQVGRYAGARDSLFCRPYMFRCVCGTERVAGIDIDSAMKPLRPESYALAG